jgi:hypothetical protein
MSVCGLKTREGRTPLQQRVSTERIAQGRRVAVDQFTVHVVLHVEAGGIGPVIEQRPSRHE